MSKETPKHIAIIMDGNGRWAKLHGKSRIEGHAAGAAVVEDVVEACKNRGVKCLTIYAFSSENWGRPSNEIAALMELFVEYIISKRDGMIEKGVQFRTIGDRNDLPKRLLEEIDKTCVATKDCDKIVLNIALNYGSKHEIVNAANKLIESGKNKISEEDIAKHLDTRGLPDPDLVIRTSGEYRISNFLLWQTAYSELYFTDINWPDFNEAELDKALKEYSKRERRYGLTSEQVGGET